MPEGNLHEYAVQAEANLEKLATGLAQSGASPETVKTVEQMADITRQIVTALGKGAENAPDEAPPEEAEESPQSYDQAAAETQTAMQESAAKRNKGA